MNDNRFEEKDGIEKKGKWFDPDADFDRDLEPSPDIDKKLEDKAFSSSNTFSYEYNSGMVDNPPIKAKKKRGAMKRIVAVVCSVLVISLGLIGGFVMLNEFGYLDDIVADLSNGINGGNTPGEGSEEESHIHTISAWICDKEATCAQVGLEHRECSDCGEILESRSISAKGHSEINHPGQSPKCKEIGWNDYITCSKCEYSTYTEIEATGHSTNDGVCLGCNVLFISSAEGLSAIGLDSECYLLCDIDLGGAVWTPIGTKYNSCFTGSFDGNGHVISNFKITDNDNYTGFFGYNEGDIKNLGLKDFTIDVENDSYVGGLVGRNNGGNITNCYTIDGYVNGDSITGGLVGEHDKGTISFCYSSCTVTSDPSDSLSHTGGLVGFNYTDGIITNSYATGDLPEAGHPGGFVGRNLGSIRNCYATGNVFGIIAGGFASTNRGLITNCYSTGNVSYSASHLKSYGYAGGFLGINGQETYYDGVVENCFATGNVSVRADSDDCYLGGLVGYEHKQYSFSIVKNSYYYSGQTFRMYKNGIYSNKPTTVVGSASELDTLKSIVFQKEALGWSEDHWILTDGKYPTLMTFDQYNQNVGSEDEGGNIHVLGSWVVLREPTCENDGLRQRVCLECNEVVITEAISSTGHFYGQWQTIAAGGCCLESYSVRICICCRIVDYDKNIDSISHPHDMKMEITEPTCTENGRIIVSCINCGIVGADEVLEKLGHDLHYVASKTMHILVCQRAGCDYKEDGEAHISSTTSPCIDNVCTACGYLIWEGIGHQFGNNYESNAEYHWPICEREDCNVEQEKQHHSSSTAKCTDASAICDVCGATFKPENAHIMGEWYIYSTADCENGEVRRRECILCGAPEEEIGAPLGHYYGEWTIITSPTETEPGEKKCVCVRCNHTQFRTISPTGHSLGAWYITDSPTCLEDGEKRRDCVDCDYYETEVVSAYGHHCSSTVVIKAPTCTLSGIKYGRCDRCGTEIEKTIAPSGHSWSSYQNNSTHHWKICSKCNIRDYYGSHVGGRNGCERGAVCSLCNYEYGEAIGHCYESNYSHDENNHYYSCLNGCGIAKGSAAHSFSVYNETVTTTDTGAEIKYTHTFYKRCDVCGYQKTEKTVVGSEHYGCKILEYVAPTCTKTGLTWGWKCAVSGCRDVYVAQEVIPALGHNYVEGICTRCGNFGSTTPGASQNGHTCEEASYVITKEPTCKSTGTRKIYCSCGKYIRQETLPTTSHRVSVIPGIDATCTSTGVSDYIECTVCGKVLQSKYTIPMLNHVTNGWIVDKEATWFSSGTKHKECLLCEEVLETKTIDSKMSFLSDFFSELLVPDYVLDIVVPLIIVFTDPYMIIWWYEFIWWSQIEEETEKMKKRRASSEHNLEEIKGNIKDDELNDKFDSDDDLDGKLDSDDGLDEKLDSDDYLNYDFHLDDDSYDPFSDLK